jgi:hypothetical protein
VLSLRTECPFTRSTLFDQEGCGVGEAIRRVGFPFGLGCWAGPAGFRVEPSVRRRLSRDMSTGALAESHRPIGVWPLLRPVVFLSARGFFQSCAPRGPQPLCSGRFLASSVGGAGGVGKRVFLRPGVQARGLCLRWCAGRESNNRVPLGTGVVLGAGADLSDQPCCRRYGVRCFLSQRRFFPAGCARCRRDLHSG